MLRKKQILMMSSVLIIAIIALNVLFLQKLNFLTFFIFMIIIPVILFSFIAASVVSIKSRNKKAHVLLGILSFIFTIILGCILYLVMTKDTINHIINNTYHLVEQTNNVSISNINVNMTPSSFVMLGFVIFVLSEINYTIIKKLEKNYVH